MTTYRHHCCHSNFFCLILESNDLIIGVKVISMKRHAFCIWMFPRPDKAVDVCQGVCMPQMQTSLAFSCRILSCCHSNVTKHPLSLQHSHFLQALTQALHYHRQRSSKSASLGLFSSIFARVQASCYDHLRAHLKTLHLILHPVWLDYPRLA